MRIYFLTSEKNNKSLLLRTKVLALGVWTSLVPPTMCRTRFKFPHPWILSPSVGLYPRRGFGDGKRWFGDGRRGVNKMHLCLQAFRWMGFFMRHRMNNWFFRLSDQNSSVFLQGEKKNCIYLQAKIIYQMARIKVENTEITIVSVQNEDYISLTDMAHCQMQEHIN